MKLTVPQYKVIWLLWLVFGKDLKTTNQNSLITKFASNHQCLNQRDQILPLFSWLLSLWFLHRSLQTLLEAFFPERLITLRFHEHLLGWDVSVWEGSIIRCSGLIYYIILIFSVSRLIARFTFSFLDKAANFFEIFPTSPFVNCCVKFFCIVCPSCKSPIRSPFNKLCILLSKAVKWSFALEFCDSFWSNKFDITIMTLTLSWRRPLSYRNQSNSANQWTGFYMITASVMKGLMKAILCNVPSTQLLNNFTLSSTCSLPDFPVGSKNKFFFQ